MRILWMKPVLPFPPTQGTRRVTLQLLQTLAPRHEIRLFTRLLDPGEREDARRLEAAVPGLAVRAEVAPNRRSMAHRVYYRAATRIGAVGGVPPVEGYTAPRSLVEAFAEEATRFDPELVVAEYWYASPYLDAVGDRPRVLFAHDVEYRVREGAGDRTRERGRGGGYGALETARERRALAGAPFLWFLTEGDRNAAAQDLDIPRDRSAVMPYGMDLETRFPLRADTDPPEPPATVLLFGSFAADFNRDALVFTLDAVWPELRRLKPDARLVVAGGGLPAGLAERCRTAGATVRGEVDDVREVLLSATVILVPLRFGGGLRIRLLESLALGGTVVGTPVGVLGMGPGAEREVLVGETARELAGQAARAIEEPALRRALGEAGRRWVAEHHGLPRSAARQLELVDETAAYFRGR